MHVHEPGGRLAATVAGSIIGMPPAAHANGRGMGISLSFVLNGKG